MSNFRFVAGKNTLTIVNMSCMIIFKTLSGLRELIGLAVWPHLRCQQRCVCAKWGWKLKGKYLSAFINIQINILTYPWPTVNATENLLFSHNYGRSKVTQRDVHHMIRPVRRMPLKCNDFNYHDHSVWHVRASACDNNTNTACSTREDMTWN